jgi:hypothetical protein
MNELKKILFDAYSGFADKRFKYLDKSDTFIIDNRSESDVGSNGMLYSYFCKIFVDVELNNNIVVTLSGNIPTSKAVNAWLNKYDYKIKTISIDSHLAIPIKQGEQSKLNGLATALKSIVASGAPRYKVANYKYVCPRTAKALTSLVTILNKAWSQQLPDERDGFF